MSFTVAGQTWIPKTAAEYAQTELDYINTGRASRGESALVASTDNAIWLELLAAGSLQQAYDEELGQASNSFSPSLCVDDQVLNLLPIVGTKLIEATFSIVDISVTAKAAGDAIIPAGTLAPYAGINFVTNALTTVPAGTTVAIPSTASASGPYTCPVGGITKFSETITNVLTVTNLTFSTTGNLTETTTGARRRIITGDTRQWGINACIRALRAINGLSAANVFFNPSATDNLVLPGPITIAPRCAYIVVKGTAYTGEIANAYYDTMSAPLNAGGAHTDYYVTQSGQLIPVLYDTATNVNTYVRVYYENSNATTAGFDTKLKQLVVNGQSGLYPGVEVTSQYFSELLAGFTLCTITGITVSTDNVTFARTAPVNGNQFPILDTARVSVIGE